MPAAEPQNPIRAFKEAKSLTYRELAHLLGCSWDYARKLGAGNVRCLSSTMARQFHERTGGGLDFLTVMAWVGSAPASAPKRPARVKP